MKQTKPQRMTKRQYSEALQELGLTQVGAAEFLQVGHRTSRRWIAGDAPIPHAVRLLFALMIKHKIAPDDVCTS
jgi:hypothetical protein